MLQIMYALRYRRAHIRPCIDIQTHATNSSESVVDARRVSEKCSWSPLRRANITCNRNNQTAIGQQRLILLSVSNSKFRHYLQEKMI